jgi:muramoyltetrapeptide carboxypeptidase
MIRASRLKPGDTIGIVSPSWGGAGRYPRRTEQGVQHLNSLGYNVKFAPHALNQHGFVSDTPANRAEDIHTLFADPEVSLILAAIGGDHSCHILPLLDFSLIQNNPKLFMGFSDITVLNVALWVKTGLVTFNGPALLPDFAEQPRILEYTQKYFLKAVSVAKPIGKIDPSPLWTETRQDWTGGQNPEPPRPMLPSAGWTWLKPGKGEGRLVGGCLESLQHLRGTPFWPEWDNTIFFFETSEGIPSSETVDGILMDYQNMGVFNKIQGLIVGRAMSYTPAEKQDLRERILERTRDYNFPIITDMDFGHTAPQFTLPVGCMARIDQGFEILEAAVTE